VLAFPQNNGLSLTPTTGVVQNGAYTIVVLARLHDVAGYRRLLDLKAGSSDDGLYASNGSLYFYPVAGATTAPITADAYHQVVLTRTSTGTVTGYVDGVQQFSFDDSSSHYGVIDSSNILRLFRDNDSGGASTEASAGAVARVRLFNDALGSSAVAALNREPPLLKLNPTGGAPGTPVDARAHGFSPGETVKLSFVDTTGGAARSVTSLGKKTADALGNVDRSVTIPPGASTDPTDKIKAKGVSSGLVATKTFTVS
jgi:hypothetical protein